MRKLKFVLLLMLIPALMQVSCKKDDDTSDVPVYRQPTAASRGEIVKIPEGLQARADEGTDFGAMIAVSYMGLANAISSFSSSFIVPEGAAIESKKSGSTVYHWSGPGYSYWMTYTELADKYTWTYDWELPDQPRFTYISAEEQKDAKKGKWTIYNPDAPTTFLWDYNWMINASNSFTASLIWNESDETRSSYDVVSNTDNSGSFKFFEATVLKSDIMWNADGSGTYWISGDGGDDLVGNWTAN